MAMFNFSKNSDSRTPSSSTPTDEVLRMRSGGLTNNQIVQTLQRDGYKSHQIFDAMNQADMRMNSPSQPDVSGEDYGMPEDNQAPPLGPGGQGSYPPQYAQEPEQAPSPQEESQNSYPDSDRIEEIAEAIIDEKWEDLTKNISKIIEWKAAVEARINSMERNIDAIKTEFMDLRKGILDKVGEYDENISHVGTQLTAMEQVFQKVLPTFTENVNELSRISRNLKKP
jgi:hypothetical protein